MKEENESKQNSVINLKKLGSRNIHYHYIGRPGPYGNPFVDTSNGNRQKCVDDYEEWIWKPEQKDLRNQMRKKLHTLPLGCFCKPLPCHGDIIDKIRKSPIED